MMQEYRLVEDTTKVVENGERADRLYMFYSDNNAATRVFVEKKIISLCRIFIAATCFVGFCGGLY